MSSLLQKISGKAGGASTITKNVAPGLLQKISTIPALEKFTEAPLTNIDEFPIPIYQFKILMGNMADPVALFQTVSGMSVSRKVESLEVGGSNNYGYEFPGQISFGHVTFGVGLTSSRFFWEWMMAGQNPGYALKMDFTLVQGRPNPKLDPAETDVFPEVKHWNFVNAFPVSWKLSDLNLDDSQKIVIESLELSFDYFELGK